MKENKRFFKYGNINTKDNNVRIKLYDDLYCTHYKETTHENIYVTELGENHFCIEADSILWEYAYDFYGNLCYIPYECKDKFRDEWVVFEEEYVGKIKRFFGKKPEKHWYGKQGYIPLQETEPIVFEFYGSLLIEDRRDI